MDYLEINKNNWNKRTKIHFDSAFYNVEDFYKTQNSLQKIETELLGDVSEKTILHLQCHFGMDTLSLAKKGGICTGVDLSDEAIKTAHFLSQKTGIPATFIESDVYKLPSVLDKEFDIVFTSYGTIGWLPDINELASVVNRFLKPGGTFVFVDFHPYMWSLDDDLKHIQYDYFNSEPIVENVQGTYADRDNTEMIESVGWNHGLSEVMSSLMNQGLQLKHFEEFDYSPYNLGKIWEEQAPGQFRPSHLVKRIPLLYSLKMVK